MLLLLGGGEGGVVFFFCGKMKEEVGFYEIFDFCKSYSSTLLGLQTELSHRWSECGQVWYVGMGNLVSMLVDDIFVYITVYVFMCRHVYVYEHDCFTFVYTSHFAFVCTLSLCTAL